jgi:serine/threonine protein kinase
MRLVAGRYALLDELGRGGMGIVWRAQDRVLGRQVALKELATPPGTTAAQLERVMREARTAGRLNDPAVVTVYDVVSEQGSTYIVMELVSAPTLADVVAESGPVAPGRLAALGLQVLGALETAHAAGIVHRDVKPSNIMVLPGDRAKLADFGIARALDDPSLTMTGGIMGSPGYMAPELFSGSGPAPASDLWALGATLFHAAEGRAPFQRETTAATLHAIMYDEPRLERTSGPLAAVIMGLLAQTVGERLSAARVRALLTAARSGPGVATEALSSADLPTEYLEPVRAPVVAETQVDWTPEPRPRRRRTVVLAGSALAVVVALGAVFLLRPDASPDTAAASGTGTPVPSTSREGSAPPPSPAAPSSAPAASTQLSPPTSSGRTVTSAPPSTEVVTVPGAPPVSKRTKVVLTRFNHPQGAHFSGTKNVGPPAGFSAEGAFGSLAAAAEPGTKKLFACRVPGTDDWFTSNDQSGGCEGKQTLGQLGFIFATPPSDAESKPVYRCNSGGSHFDSLSEGCEGKIREFLLGYLLS